MLLRLFASGTLLVLGFTASVPTRAAAQASAFDSLLAAPSLDLRLLERAVLERNPSVGAMRAAWRGAEAAADQAGGLDDPMLELMAAPRSWSRSSVDPAYAVGLSQHLPLFGQRGLSARVGGGEARRVGWGEQRG